jgi:hypothetical protein
MVPFKWKRPVPLLLIRALFAVALAAACSSSTAPEASEVWGGTEASLTLTPAGGSVSYPCGSGTIDSGWTIGGGGRLLGTGQHFFGGGPLPPEGRPPHAARYFGQISGTALTLSVIVTDLRDTLGPYQLTRGGPEVMEQCL